MLLAQLPTFYMQILQIWGTWQFFIDTTRIALQRLSLTPIPQTSQWQSLNLLTWVVGGGREKWIFSIYTQERSSHLYVLPQRKEEKKDILKTSDPLRMERMLGSHSVWIVNKVSPGIRKPGVFQSREVLVSSLFIYKFLGANLDAYLRMFGFGGDKRRCIILSDQNS